MRFIRGGLLAWLILVLASYSVYAAFISDKPLYAVVVLDEKGAKAMSIAFDESGGTGKGYDTVYADLNFNGSLTDEKAVRCKLETQGDFKYGSFPPIAVPVLYNQKAMGISKPYELLFVSFKNGENWMCQVAAQIKLKDGSGVWEYTIPGPLRTCYKPELAKKQPAILGGKPSLEITAQPGKDGQLGIAVYLAVGGQRAMCKKSGKEPAAQIVAKNANGKSVYSKSVGMDKLVPG